MDDEDVLEQEREHIRAEIVLNQKKQKKNIIIEPQIPIFIDVPQQNNDLLHPDPIYFYPEKPKKTTTLLTFWDKFISFFK